VRKRSAGSACIAVAVVRVSTDKQDLGPEAQWAQIEAWAARQSIQVPICYIERDVSGATPLEDREGLLEAITSLRSHGAGVLVFAKRDRIARDIAIAAGIEAQVQRQGATIRTADGTSDGTGPEGAMFRGILDVFSAYERGVIKARTKAALITKKARGERVGKVPFGYRLSADGIHLEAEPTEQAVIKQVRQLRANGASTYAITEALAAKGVVGRTGKPLRQTQVWRICAG
jgi:DNA invertase Pin-like site-specific DNA recombinase